jgi:hypothetical protein
MFLLGVDSMVLDLLSILFVDVIVGDDPRGNLNVVFSLFMPTNVVKKRVFYK